MNPVINPSRGLFILLLLFVTATPVDAELTQGGSIKFSALGYALEDRDTPTLTQYGGLGILSTRYNLESQGEGGLSFQMHYQLSGYYQTDPSASQLGYLFGSGTATDQGRLFNLSQSLSANTQQRIDRLNIAYSGERLVWRLGRQAVGWGNGFTFHVLDFLNPAAPGSLDSDYKVGDDMIYLQWLTRRGNDWQLAYIGRRDLASGLATPQVATLAWKFHWVTEGGDYDLMLARHFDQTMFGLGMAKDVHGWILRVDFLQHDITSSKDQLWLINSDFVSDWWGKNHHIFFEYYHNELAQSQIDYASVQLTPLWQRLARGELYVMGRDYIALGWMMQVNALNSVGMNILYNLGDHSNTVTMSYAYDFKQNLQLQAGVMLTIGGANTEFGGLWDTSGAGDYLPTANLMFLQFAQYF